ncbi:hypothetical protein BDQ17DRAFT_1336731 [Cyathus striatus]|nr:hypothetical protein BDQ17DRAFT_1336731 [Cyathus striatus]
MNLKVFALVACKMREGMRDGREGCLQHCVGAVKLMGVTETGGLRWKEKKWHNQIPIPSHIVTYQHAEDRKLYDFSQWKTAMAKYNDEKSGFSSTEIIEVVYSNFLVKWSFLYNVLNSGGMIEFGGRVLAYSLLRMQALSSTYLVDNKVVPIIWDDAKIDPTTITTNSATVLKRNLELRSAGDVEVKYMRANSH